MNAVLKYPGAKNRLVPWICKYIPDHKVYLEPYFGSGAVFFNKVPAKIETINDLDDNVVNYFQVIRNHPGQVLLSGYDNSLYDEYLHDWKKVHKKTQAEGGLKRTETLWMNY